MQISGVRFIEGLDICREPVTLSVIMSLSKYKIARVIRCAMDCLLFFLVLRTIKHMSMPALGSAIISYVFIWSWTVSIETSHHGWCRASTSIAASGSTAYEYSLSSGVALLLVVMALPRSMLWWPQARLLVEDRIPLTDDHWRDLYLDQMSIGIVRRTRSVQQSLMQKWNALSLDQKQSFKDEYLKAESLPIHSKRKQESVDGSQTPDLHRHVLLKCQISKRRKCQRSLSKQRSVLSTENEGRLCQNATFTGVETECMSADMVSTSKISDCLVMGKKQKTSQQSTTIIDGSGVANQDLGVFRDAEVVTQQSFPGIAIPYPISQLMLARKVKLFVLPEITPKGLRTLQGRLDVARGEP